LKILFVTPIDVTKKYGDVIRILELVKCASTEHEVTLVSGGLPDDIATTILSGTVTTVQVPAYIFRVPIVGLRYLIPLIKKYTPDIIQAEMPNAACLCGIAGKMTNTPIIFDIHGDTIAELKFYKTIFYPYKLIFYPLAYRIALNTASYILVVSERQKNILKKKYKIDSSRIFVVPNGFTPENLIRPPQNHLEKNEYVKTKLCFVGSLPKWAKVDMLIEGFKQVLDECGKNYLLYIVGDGTERKNLESLAQRCGISEHVIFTGRVPYDKVKEYVYSSDILVAPFPKDLALEVACPIKLLEYAYVGKPIVTVEVGDIPRLLKKENAAVVTAPDVDSFAQGIIKIINSKEQQKIISENAKKLAKDFTWEKQGEKLVKIYDELFEIKR
jgi:glycosyltransferase involved in cell wall biosynthesis